MNFKLNGISTPLANVSWNNCESTKDKVKQLFFILNQNMF